MKKIQISCLYFLDLLIIGNSMSYVGGQLALDFNVTGYEKCVFNILFTDSGSFLVNGSSSNADFLDHLVNSNREKRQLWYIHRIHESGNNTVQTSFIKSNYWKEMCSINFVVNFSFKPGLPLLNIFGSRLYSERNILYFVHGLSIHLRNVVLVNAQNRVVVDLVVLHLNSDTLSLLNASYVCMRWLLEHELPKIRNSYKHLSKIRKFASDIEAQSVVPVIAALSQRSGEQYSARYIKLCRFLYPQRQPEYPSMIGCIPDLIFIENIGAKLNYSVDYIAHHNSLNKFIGNERDLPKPYVGVSFLCLINWVRWNEERSPENIMKQQLTGVETSKFFYCSRTAKRRKFSVLFWTLPFDSCSWILIGISILANYMILKMQLFQVFGILVRQECRYLRGRRKLAIVFVLVAIVFTYGYEGVISSFLTVSPPLDVYAKLKPMVEDGYKIMLPSGSDIETTRNLFKRENITGSINSMILWIPWSTYQRSGTEEFLHSNVTGTISLDDQKRWIANMREIDPTLSCNCVSDVVLIQNNVFHFMGLARRKLAEISELLIQSGILDLFRNNYKYVINLNWTQAMDMFEFEERQSKPFKMGDWKILSIFIALLSLLGLSFLAFVAENIYLYMKHQDWTFLIQLFR